VCRCPSRRPRRLTSAGRTARSGRVHRAPGSGFRPATASRLLCRSVSARTGRAHSVGRPASIRPPATGWRAHEHDPRRQGRVQRARTRRRAGSPGQCTHANTGMNPPATIVRSKPRRRGPVVSPCSRPVP
jgi:hypothetical protein